jgi:hypothetical protein
MFSVSFAKCQLCYVANMLVMLSVGMLSVGMLNVAMLSVVAHIFMLALRV